MTLPFSRELFLGQSQRNFHPVSSLSLLAFRKTKLIGQLFADIQSHQLPART